MLLSVKLYAAILIPAGVLVAVAAVFAVLLAFLGRKLEVKRDEKVVAVESLLSGANCGGCGFAGCSAFAEALANGKADLSSCNATSKVNKDKIAAILGTVNDGEEMSFVVCCSGGNACEDKYDYHGYGDCASMELLAGGRKACPVGCMGAGTCVKHCDHHACNLTDNGYASITDERCTLCGKCSKSCPKGLIKKIPARAKVYVACSNHGKGKEIRSYCKAGCIGCGMCMRTCPEGAITLVDNLAVIDYSKCIGCGACAAKCPSKCIKTRD